jgi:hypothetical protein
MRLLTPMLAMMLLAAPAAHAQQQTLSPSELQAVRAMINKIKANWNPDTSVFSQSDQYVIVRVHLDRNGRLSAPPELVGVHPVSQWGLRSIEAAAEAAKRAIVASQPFDMLSPSNYDAWKEVEIRFNPVELKSLGQQPQSR